VSNIEVFHTEPLHTLTRHHYVRLSIWIKGNKDENMITMVQEREIKTGKKGEMEHPKKE